jgi:hypothetical protein
MRAMSLRTYLFLPVGIAIVAAVYWWFSQEAAGSVMLIVFALAMTVMGLILVPTAGDVGPTAPVDPDWHERQRETSPGG